MATPAERATSAALDALARAKTADRQWPAAVVFVPDLAFLVMVDGAGIVLRGPLAPAVAERLEGEAKTGGLPVEVDGGAVWGAAPPSYMKGGER